MSKTLLTMHEASILFDLAEAWYKYTLLPDHYPDDSTDFRKAVHDAQRIILARPGRRQMGKVAGYGSIVPRISLDQLKEMGEQLKELETSSKKSHAFTAETISELDGH